MSYYTTKYRKYCVRVCLDTKKSTSFQTLGPYTQNEALILILKHLSTGICSWIEEID
jgi:hypothetical protein